MNQRGSKMRSLVRRGWLSNEHGAWVMTVLPIAVGICTVHPQPIQFLLLAAWTAAYCAFHALSLYWAASPKRRRTYLPAFLTWASIAVVCGIPVIVMHPHAIARIIIPSSCFAQLQLTRPSASAAVPLPPTCRAFLRVRAPSPCRSGLPQRAILSSNSGAQR